MNSGSQIKAEDILLQIHNLEVAKRAQIFNVEVVVDGKIVTYLNSHLIARQKLNDEDVERLKLLHIGQYSIREQMKLTDDKYLLKMFAEMITLIEFELQRTWKFPMDANWHRFWTLPKCLCPQMDNNDAYPTGRYVRVQNCPIHGWE